MDFLFGTLFVALNFSAGYNNNSTDREWTGSRPGVPC